MHTVKYFQVLLFIRNNLIKHYSFVYTHINGQTALFQTSQFNKSLFFTHRLNDKQVYLTYRFYLIRCDHFGPEWTWVQLQRRVTPHFPNYWSITIKLFNVIPGHSLVCVCGGVLPLCRDAVGVFYSPSRLG